MGAVLLVPFIIAGAVGWYLAKGAQKPKPLPEPTKPSYREPDEFLEDAIRRLIHRVVSDPNSVPDVEILNQLDYAITDLYKTEVQKPVLYGTERPSATMLESVVWEYMETFISHVPDSVRVSKDEFYRQADGQVDVGLTISLLELMEKPKQAILDVVLLFFAQTLRDNGLFRDLRNQLDENALAVSSTKEFLTPDEYEGTPHETAIAFLKNTPLLEPFLAQVPFSIPDKIRFEHTYCLAPSGAGKTTLIERVILDDLSKEDSPALVVIDPKGLMVQRLSRLEAIKHRLVVLDPNTQPLPALNMFASTQRDLPAHIREQLQSHVVSNFAYIFSSVDSPLTQRQSVCFSFCIRLLMHQESNIHTLMELLDERVKDAELSRFYEAIQRCDQTTRRFFETEYFTSTFGETRGQIKARLYSIVMHPSFVHMFGSNERKLDMFDCLQERKVVLVNSALGIPGSSASQLFARYMIALTLNAAFERTAIPRKQWNPAHLVIDEFQLVADEVKTPEMLRLAREYNLGIFLAMQDMHGKPFNEALRTAISTNTSIKYASSPEGVDMNYAARDLRTTDDYLRAATKTRTHGRFACFVRGMLDRPITLTLPFGAIDHEPMMPPDEHRALMQRLREQLASDGPAPNPLPDPVPTPDGTSSVSTEEKIEESSPTHTGAYRGEWGDSTS